MSVRLISGNVAGAFAIHPGQQRCQLCKGAAGRVGGRHHDATGDELRVRGDLGHREDGRDAGVGAGQELHPLVARPRGERAGDGGPDLRLCLLVVLGCGELGAAEGPAQVGEELGLDGPDGQPAPVGRGVGGVAGEATGEDVVPGPDVAPEGELLVDGQRHEPEHALGHGHVEVGPGTGGGPAGQSGGDGQGGLEATGGGVGDGGPGQRRRALLAWGAHDRGSRRRPSSRCRARPTGRAGRPARSRWSSSTRCRDCGPTRRRGRYRAGRPHPGGSSRPRRRPRQPAPGRPHARRRPSGQGGRGASALPAVGVERGLDR